MMIAYLEKVEPKQHMLRFYALRVAPTLFGEWTLIREWGRIGSPGTVRLEWFDRIVGWIRELVSAEFHLSWPRLIQKLRTQIICS